MKKFFEKLIRAIYYVKSYVREVRRIKKKFKENDFLSNHKITFRASRFGVLYTVISLKDLVHKDSPTQDLSYMAEVLMLDYLNRLRDQLLSSGMISAFSSPVVEKVEGTKYSYLVQLHPYKYNFMIASLKFLFKISLVLLTLLIILILI